MSRDCPASRGRQVGVVVPTVTQAAHLAACLAALGRTRLPSGWTLDTVVVLNGASPDVREVARRADGARLVCSDVNRGFAGGCQLGARATEADYLAFLNDDVRVEPEWLLPLLETLEAMPRAGAVAPRVLGTDGTVQEIGSVIWRDGTTRPFGRGAPSASLAWRWRRRVDYASGCALLVRRAAWEAVGGFDEGYHPAYYEDVDFCLGLEAAGYEVWVDPRSDVVHAESASSTTAFKHFLFERHHARLVARWSPALAGRVEAPAAAADVAAAEAAAADRLATPGPRVLVVDDRTPQYGLGSGFDRMADTLIDLAAAGARLRCAVTEHAPMFSPVVAAAGVELIDGSADEPLAAALAACDLAIISRPNNAARVRRLLAARPQTRPPRIVYDAEALYHRRACRQAALADGEVAAALRAQAGGWQDTERAIARHADGIVCVSADEAAFFREEGARDVRVVTPWLRRAAPTSGSLQGRADIGFVAGWLGGASSPNGDALEWFASEILPHIVAEVPWVRLRVTGTLPPPLRRLEGLHLRAEGFVPDLARFYGQVRVAVAPLRFGAGVKLKTIEAVQFGVPVIATTVGAEGLDALHGEAIVVRDEAREFAAAVVARLTDVTVWRAHRLAVDRACARVPQSNPWGPIVEAATKEARRVGRPV